MTRLTSRRRPVDARRASRSFGLLLVAFMLALLIGACDSGPSGAGTLSVTVEGPEGSPGAALILVSGEGVTGFTARGGTQLFHERAGEAEGTWRVVVVNPGEGALEFGVEVRDLGSARVSGRILELSDRENERVAQADLETYHVRIFR